MKFCFELTTKTDIKKIWALYANVNKWYSWEAELESISLSGDFSQGTLGVMKLFNRPEIKFELTSVIENKEFVDRTSIPNFGDIYFIHQLIPMDDKVTIRHCVEFIPFNHREISEEDSTFISKIFSDVPASVFSLIEASNE